jgi:hypothetical protein
MPVMTLTSAGSLQDFVLEFFWFCVLFLKLKLGEKKQLFGLVDVIIFY